MKNNFLKEVRDFIIDNKPSNNIKSNMHEIIGTDNRIIMSICLLSGNIFYSNLNINLIISISPSLEKKVDIFTINEITHVEETIVSISDNFIIESSSLFQTEVIRNINLNVYTDLIELLLSISKEITTSTDTKYDYIDKSIWEEIEKDCSTAI